MHGKESGAARFKVPPYIRTLTSRVRATNKRYTLVQFAPVTMKSAMTNVQIFGVKNSPATRAAERFFKERRIAIQFVDLKQKAMAPGEIKRFIDRFGLKSLLDAEGAAYVDAGLKYLKVSDTELLGKIEKEPRLLRLPLVRAAKRISIGQDEAAWKEMADNAG
jgi:arsenate reductase (glutaredoxin)